MAGQLIAEAEKRDGFRAGIAAVFAGLGVVGKNNLLVDRKWGRVAGFVRY